MFHDWIFGKPAGGALLLAFALFALPAAAQPPVPPSPPDFSWHGGVSGEAPPPAAPREGARCRGLFSCRARLVGELWKKGGVALDITPFSW